MNTVKTELQVKSGEHQFTWYIYSKKAAEFQKKKTPNFL